MQKLKYKNKLLKDLYMPRCAVALIHKLPIPVPHETMTPLTMPVVDSQLEFFEVANYNLNNGSDPTLLTITPQTTFL